MRIAIPLRGLRLASHYDESDQFAVIDADTQSGNVMRLALLPLPSRDTAARIHWLQGHHVNLILANGMDKVERDHFTTAGLPVKHGHPGDTIETLVRSYFEHVNAPKPHASQDQITNPH